MVKLKNTFLLLVGLIATVFSIAAVTSRSSLGQNSDAGTRPVRVVNTTSEPIPVTGTTTIGGAVSLAQGTTVGISGSPTVQVGNSANSPVIERDVDNPARQPYQNKLCFGSGCSSTPPGFFVVPGGKRLVIEYITVQASGSTGTKIPIATLSTEVNGAVIQHSVTPEFLTSIPGQDFFGLKQQTRIYCDPGTTVDLLALGSFDFIFITVSGYLVDVQ